MKNLIVICICCSFLMGCVPLGERTTAPAPPGWAYGWHAGITYYYFPNWGIYYDVYRDHWIWYDGFFWVHRHSPPAWCANVNFRRVYRVPLNYSGRSPHVRHREHISRFPPRVHGQYRGPSRGRIEKAHPNTRQQAPRGKDDKGSFWKDNRRRQDPKSDRKQRVSPKQQQKEHIRRPDPRKQPSKDRIQRRNPPTGKDRIQHRNPPAGKERIRERGSESQGKRKHR